LENLDTLMKTARALLIVACCLGVGYGYWGAFTESGNQRYDEMDALLPFFIMLGSIGLLAIMGLYYLVVFMIKRRQQ